MQLGYGGLPETGLQLPRNPATTEDEVVLVEHAGLPGRWRVEGVKANGGAAVFTGSMVAVAGMIVPNARGGLDRPVNSANGIQLQRSTSNDSLSNSQQDRQPLGFPRH